jgi:hypothetical protein
MLAKAQAPGGTSIFRSITAVRRHAHRQRSGRKEQRLSSIACSMLVAIAQAGRRRAGVAGAARKLFRALTFLHPACLCAPPVVPCMQMLALPAPESEYQDRQLTESDKQFIAVGEETLRQCGFEDIFTDSKFLKQGGWQDSRAGGCRH